MKVSGIPVGILERRARLADETAKGFIGVLYGVLALHLNRKRLKRAADWPGVIESLSIELCRYADGESTRLLSGELPAPTPFLARRRSR